MIKKEMLMRFVAKNDYRTFLNSPMRLGGFIYASNGHILVRVKDDPEIEASNDMPVGSKIPSLFDRVVAEFYELPPLPDKPDTQKCESCNGTGYVTTVECDECEDGEFFYGSHYYECKECDGQGKITATSVAGHGKECNECCGSGHNDVFEMPVKVGRRHYQPKYLRLIASLPHARIEHTTNNTGARFIFTGGDGVVMPYAE